MAHLNIQRILIGALLGAPAIWAGIIIFFGPIQGFLGDPDLQSDKFIRFFTEFGPPPRTTEEPLMWAPITMAAALGFSIVYALVRGSVHAPGAPFWKAGLKFGLILFLTAALWFELITPYNFFREPVPLVLLELVSWYLTMTLTALTIAAAHEVKRRD